MLSVQLFVEEVHWLLIRKEEEGPNKETPGAANLWPVMEVFS